MEKYFESRSVERARPYFEISKPVRFNLADNIGTHSFVKRIAINESEWFRSGGGLIREANCNETINQNSFNNEIQCARFGVEQVLSKASIYLSYETV